MTQASAPGSIAARWLFPLLLPCVAAFATTLGFVATDALIHTCVQPLDEVPPLNPPRRT